MPCLAALCLSAFLVVDGDTVKLPAPGKDLYFRIWGIDAPEGHADTCRSLPSSASPTGDSRTTSGCAVRHRCGVGIDWP